MTINKRTMKVWDGLVRTGHWTLVIAFFTAYLSEDDFLNIHIWAGYVVGIYLLIRILWGFVGGKYARFSAFLYSPASIISYLRGLKAGVAQHYIGHNPAGGAMVIALLLSLSITTLTGLKLYAVEKNEGPFALLEQDADRFKDIVRPVASAKAEKAGEDKSDRVKIINTQDEDEEIWEESHELFANLTLLLVALHIVGVVLSSRIDKENLVKSMLTGKKEVDDSYE